MKQNSALKGRWMIVDDEHEASWLIQRMLEFATGREVECYSSSKEALLAIRAEPRAYDLVVTDFNMPEMNGDQLRAQLRVLAPDLKVLLTTGNPDWNEEVALHRGFDGFLAKPFSIAQVRDVALSLVREILPLRAA